MRNSVFLLATHLGKSPVAALRIEQRIVAEASLAVLLGGNRASNDSLKEILLSIQNQRYGRSELRCAILCAAESLQQKTLVGLIVVAIGRITCRAYPRLATQSINLQTRIIGKAIEPRAGVDIARLRERITLERRLILGNILRNAALTQRHNLKLWPTT